MQSKQLKSKLLNIFSHPLFLAIPIALLIILTLPPFFNKYNASVIQKKTTDNAKTNRYFYYDMDNDGVGEMVQFHLNSTATTALKFWENATVIINQENIPEPYYDGAETFFGDFDNNSHNEFYIFSLQDSFLYLNSFEMINLNKFIKRRKYITSLILNEKSVHGGDIFYGLRFLLQFILKRRLEARYEAEKQLSELQLKTRWILISLSMR